MLDFLVVYLPGLLIVGGLIMMIGFGAKNASARLRGQGSLAIAAFALPLVVFGAAYLVNAGDDSALAIASIVTAVVLILSGLAALVVAGVRGLVK
ncbi:MAG: hypothetical protein AAF791_09805 [Bacteroidota bacterium]